MKKINNQKGLTQIVIVLLILVVLATAGFAAFQYMNKPQPMVTGFEEVNEPDQQTTVETTVENENLNPELEAKSAQLSYSKEGNLVFDNGKWKLLYDDPETGNPAATNDLEFTNNSKCDLGKGAQVCNPDDFTVGTRVQVDGVEKEESVSVVKMILVQ